VVDSRGKKMRIVKNEDLLFYFFLLAVFCVVNLFLTVILAIFSYFYQEAYQSPFIFSLLSLLLSSVFLLLLYRKATVLYFFDDTIQEKTVLGDCVRILETKQLNRIYITERKNKNRKIHICFCNSNPLILRYSDEKITLVKEKFHKTVDIEG